MCPIYKFTRDEAAALRAAMAKTSHRDQLGALTSAYVAVAARLKEGDPRAGDEAAALREAMAKTAGMSLGHVTSIHEGAWHYGYSGWWRGSRQWTNMQNVVQELASEGAIMLEDGSLSLGQIVVRAEVSLTTEIVPD